MVGFGSEQGGQHYLPQFYLRAWGRKTGNTYQVNAYDLEGCRWFRTSTKNICQQKAFYNVGSGSGLPFAILPESGKGKRKVLRQKWGWTLLLPPKRMTPLASLSAEPVGSFTRGVPFRSKYDPG
ncbi:MAG: DUF4238 domain-containing protein [Candidatus Methylomirabilales bacterium]